MENKNVAREINKLLVYLHDSRNEFDECCEEIADIELKALFGILSSQRHCMIREMQECVALLGEEPINCGSATSALDRSNIGLQSLITCGETKAVVNEMKHGENILIELCNELLAKDVPSHVSTVINQHVSSVKNNLIKIDEKI